MTDYLVCLCECVLCACLNSVRFATNSFCLNKTSFKTWMYIASRMFTELSVTNVHTSTPFTHIHTTLTIDNLVFTTVFFSPRPFVLIRFFLFEKYYGPGRVRVMGQGRLAPVYPRQSNPRGRKPERCTCTRAFVYTYHGLDDFHAARQASRFRPATA